MFSGCGGLTKACSPLCTTVAYCENDERAVAVLAARMQDGRFPRSTQDQTRQASETGLCETIVFERFSTCPINGVAANLSPNTAMLGDKFDATLCRGTLQTCPWQSPFKDWRSTTEARMAGVDAALCKF